MAYGYGGGGSFFERGILALERIGLTDVLLPFMLVFTLVFAVAHKSKMFGEHKKNVEVMIALIMGLAVVIPHVTGAYPPGMDVVNIINRALPNVSLVVIAILMVMLLIGLFGGTPHWTGSNINGIIALIAFVLVVYIFGAAANFWTIADKFWFLSDPDTQALLVVILVFGILVYFITKEEGTVGERSMEQLANLFKKYK